jgi:1-pyrroline-5-carboxylate dehydrogenase
MAIKITYATLGGDQLDDLHRALDEAIVKAPHTFGREHLLQVNGQTVKAAEQFDDRSPIDTSMLMGRFQQGTREHVRAAIAAARAAYPAWVALGWQQRLVYVRKIAEAIRGHRWDLSALMGYEVGKNRLECLGDVEEAADLISYYCDQIEEHDGFVERMGTLGAGEENLSVLRPYGVWAVISPFNFPLALAAGPAGGALASGNTVVFKPASATPLLGAKLNDMTVEAGLPPGVFNFITGPGSTAGQEMIDNPGIDGIVFTGSKEVGLKLMRDNAARPIPRPLIIEMGGKNPAIITTSADLDKASDGVMRSAFGAQGQKCSACSRVYIQREVRDQFVAMLVEKTERIKVGNPLERDVWMGPVINEAAVSTYLSAVERAKKDGGTILTGGRRISDPPFDRGYFVEPTVIDGLPAGHPLFSEELFVPITVLADVVTLDEALELANRTEYGLTAGIYSENEDDLRKFFDRIQAGVTYANRRAGATTGAWPGVNPFGGWKASGSTGRGTGGPYYVQQFMREQSRVRIREGISTPA